MKCRTRSSAIAKAATSGSSSSCCQRRQDARRLADIRYRGGATSYLEVLDSDTRMFSAELGVTQAELSELLALVQIYRSLGGGWQPFFCKYLDVGVLAKSRAGWVWSCPGQRGCCLSSLPIAAGALAIVMILAWDITHNTDIPFPK